MHLIPLRNAGGREAVSKATHWHPCMRGRVCVCVHATLLPASVNLQVQHPWGCTQTLCVRWQHQALPAPALAGPEGCRSSSSSSSSQLLPQGKVSVLPPGMAVVTPQKSLSSSVFPAPL